MATLAPRLVSAMRRRWKPRHEVTIDSPGHLMEMTHWAEKRPLRLLVPTKMMRMQGAFAYGTGHPFVAALSGGPDALRGFYDHLQPKTLCAYYGLKNLGQTGADLPPWELPWYLRRNRTPPPGELGLGPEHGVSFYGPATPEKIALEYRRLSGLAAAISARGYDPDGHGDIEGYVLRDGTRAAFFVRGGKHRAAVLAASGATTIPVSFRASFPRLVDADQADIWPLVRSGQIDPSLARDILRVYVAGRSIAQDLTP